VGTYEFTTTDTPEKIVDKIISGKTVTIKVTIQEGLNIYQVSQKLNFYFPEVSSSEWLRLMQDERLRKYVSPDNPPPTLEGYLYPESYFFDPHDKPEVVIRTLIGEFKKHVNQKLFMTGAKIGLNANELLTLASIIEKETGLESEKNMVAAVYLNRLKKRMRLQADPTVIYGMGENYKGFLTKHDLQTPTPYNTYTQTGLPPGPIANPNVSSIMAVLNPAQTDALYFVARGDQPGHVFSKNLREHNIAVKRYIEYLRKAKANEKFLRP
jgi:UPF0755 protein